MEGWRLAKVAYAGWTAAADAGSVASYPLGLSINYVVLLRGGGG